MQSNCLEFLAMNDVQNPSQSECYTIVRTLPILPAMQTLPDNNLPKHTEPTSQSVSHDPQDLTGLYTSMVKQLEPSSST
jgi:hypothetical protein